MPDGGEPRVLGDAALQSTTLEEVASAVRYHRSLPGEGPLLTVWDSAVVPVARAVEQRIRAPFGQSLLAIARAPGGRTTT